MHPCIRTFRLISVVGCKREWTILVCGRDWLWLCLYLYVRNGLHHDNVIHTLARLYCLPHSQWLLLELEWFFARLTAEHAYTWDTLYFYQLIYPTFCDVTHPLFDMSPFGNTMSCRRMYRMIGHRMQRQQTPPRQKVSQEIRRAHHPQFFFFRKENYPNLVPLFICCRHYNLYLY